MDQKSQEYLSEILTKNPEELSKDEITFLRARRSYLKNTQLEEYKSVLTAKNLTSEEKSEPVKQNAKNSKTN